MIYKIHHEKVICQLLKGNLMLPPPRKHHSHSQQFCFLNNRTKYQRVFPSKDNQRLEWPCVTVNAKTADTFVSSLACSLSQLCDLPYDLSEKMDYEIEHRQFAVQDQTPSVL